MHGAKHRARNKSLKLVMILKVKAAELMHKGLKMLYRTFTDSPTGSYLTGSDFESIEAWSKVPFSNDICVVVPLKPKKFTCAVQFVQEGSGHSEIYVKNSQEHKNPYKPDQKYETEIEITKEIEDSNTLVDAILQFAQGKRPLGARRKFSEGEALPVNTDAFNSMKMKIEESDFFSHFLWLNADHWELIDHFMAPPPEISDFTSQFLFQFQIVECLKEFTDVLWSRTPIRGQMKEFPLYYPFRFDGKELSEGETGSNYALFLKNVVLDRLKSHLISRLYGKSHINEGEYFGLWKFPYLYSNYFLRQNSIAKMILTQRYNLHDVVKLLSFFDGRTDKITEREDVKAVFFTISPDGSFYEIPDKNTIDYDLFKEKLIKVQCEIENMRVNHFRFKKVEREFSSALRKIMQRADFILLGKITPYGISFKHILQADCFFLPFGDLSEREERNLLKIKM